MIYETPLKISLQLFSKKLLFTMFFFSFSIYGQTINIIKFNNTTNYTAGSGVSVIINPTGVFAVNNVFILELSNASGSFASPAVLNSLSEFYVPVTNGVLPASTPAGTGYKLRIRSTAPVTTTETAAFSVVTGVAVAVPKINSNLAVNATNVFNCIGNNCISAANSNIFGKLQVNTITAGNPTTTNTLDATDRTLNICPLVGTTSINLLKIDRNATIATTTNIVAVGTSFEIPSNLPIGTYVFEIENKVGTNSSIISNIFLFHGNASGLNNTTTDEICLGGNVSFSFQPDLSGIGRNYMGSKYVINYGDGTPVEEFTHEQLMSNPIISHTYSTVSCGSTTGGDYTVILNLKNKGIFSTPNASTYCNNYFDNGNQATKAVNTSRSPVADFISPAKHCVSTPLFVDNTTVLGLYGTTPCINTPNFRWFYKSPSATTFVLADALWINTSGDLTIPATALNNEVGCWEFKLTAKNNGGCDTTSEKIKTVKVEQNLAPSFTHAPVSPICPNTAIQFTETTNVTNRSCQELAYNWIITKDGVAATNPGNITLASPSSLTSINPQITFVDAGIYTILLRITNSCGVKSSTITTIVVSGSPSASFTPNNSSDCFSNPASKTLNFGVAPYKPTYSTGALLPASFLWTVSGSNVTAADYSFVGGTTATSEFPQIKFDGFKTFVITVKVDGSCIGSTSTTYTYTLKEIPIVTNTSLTQTVCGGATTAIPLTSSLTGSTFTWTVLQTTGTTGATPGSGTTIPSQNLANSSSTPGTATYVITPLLNGCAGTPVNYVITVNPSPQVSISPSSFIVCQNGTATTLSTTISNTTATPSYEWFSNSTNSTVGSTQVGTSATYQPTTSAIGLLYYYCVVTFMPSGSCGTSTSNIIAVNTVANPSFSNQPIAVQKICAGGTISNPLSVSYTGGSGTPTYQWYGNNANSNTGGTLILNSNTPSYTPPAFNATGNYFYYATIALSGNGCGPIVSTVAMIDVVADPIVDSQPIATQTLCQGATPASLSVTISGGEGAASYQWYSNNANNSATGILIPGQTSSTFVPPTSVVGTTYYYCVIKQTGLNCEVKSNVSSISVNNAPTFSSQPSSGIVCQNGFTPVLTAVTTSGTGAPTFEWFLNTTNSAVGGTSVGTSQNYQPITATTGTNYYYCVATFPSTGGCSSVTSTIATITVTTNATFSVQPLLDQKICVGGTVAAPLSVSYTGGTGTAIYQWYSNTINSNSGGTIISGANSASFTPSSSLLSIPNNYYFYVTLSLSGNGCSPISSNVAKIEVVPDPVVSTQPIASQTLCQGATPLSLLVTILGGEGSASYEWYANTVNNNISGVLLASQTSNILVPPTSAVGTLYYYCIIKQNGLNCEVRSNVSTIAINTAPTFATQPQSSIVCKNETATALSTTVSNGTGTPTFEWFSNQSNSIVGGTSISTSQNYQPVTSIIGTTYYYCVVTFPATGGCSSVTSNIATVTVNDVPQITNKNELICSGNPVTITPQNNITDNVPPNTTYFYELPTFSPASGIIGASTGVNVPSISQTLVNTTTAPIVVVYTIVPKTGNCISASFTITIVVNPAIAINQTLTNLKCFGVNTGSIATNATGGIPFSGANPYQYSWTGPNGFNSNLSAITGLSTGVYNLTIIDQGGCPSAVSYTITEPLELAIATDSKTDISCFGANNGQINITVTGGTLPYIYNWTRNGVAFSALEDLSNLQAGLYNLVLTDTNNCAPKSASFTIIEPTKLTVLLVSQTNILCAGAQTGAVSVQASGGIKIELSPGVFDYQYQWTGPNGFVSSNKNLINIFAGSYTLTVTDQNNCQTLFNTQISEPIGVSVTVTTTKISCYGANDASINLAIAGGIPPFEVTWSNFATGTFQNNLSANDYNISIKDANNCVKTIVVTIPEAPIFAISPIVKQISCFGNQDGSINLNFVGGKAPISFAWLDSATAGSVRNNLAAGTYTVIITDSTPCNITRTFTIIEPQLLQLSATIINAFNCTNANSGGINLLVSGGTPPFTYSWNNGATAEDLIDIPAGNYLVTVTDSRLCSKTAQFAVNRPQPLVANVDTKTDVDCVAKTVKQLFEAKPTGGIPPYQFIWSSGTISGSNNQFMNTSVNGTIILNVTDSFGCTANYSLNVNTPTLGTPSFTAGSFAFTTYGVHSVQDPIQFSNNATGNFVSVSWDFGDGSVSNEPNPTHVYNAEGDYIIVQTVTYPLGCVFKYTTTLIVNKGYSIIIPDAFTPNDDKINDTFAPIFKGLKEVKIEIYDTWGEMIFSEQGDNLKGWDGTIKGFSGENGNYYYKISATTFYGLIINKNAPLTLIK